jgi:hypothetical protein
MPGVEGVAENDVERTVNISSDIASVAGPDEALVWPGR